ADRAAAARRCATKPTSSWSAQRVERGSEIEAPIMLRSGNVAASRGSRPGRDAVALLLLSGFAPTTVVGQRAPQPVFTELFAYDPAVPSQLLGKWLGSQPMPAREPRSGWSIRLRGGFAAAG